LRAAIPRLIRLPTVSTLLRTVRLIAVAVKESVIAQVITPEPPTVAAPRIVTPAGTLLDSDAVYGKALRGMTIYGNTHLVRHPRLKLVGLRLNPKVGHHRPSDIGPITDIARSVVVSRGCMTTHDTTKGSLRTAVCPFSMPTDSTLYQVRCRVGR
jgi:hypothetical protein